MYHLNMLSGRTSQPFWDRLGMGLSGLCAIHCLFFPVAVALMPLWPVTEAIHTWTHPILFLLILPTVFFALKENRGDRRIPVLLYSGLAAVALAWLIHDLTGDIGEVTITMAGSALLVTGHWFNYRQHKIRCKTGSDHETT